MGPGTLSLADASFPGSLSNPGSPFLLMLNHESDPRGFFPRTSRREIGSM